MNDATTPVAGPRCWLTKWMNVRTLLGGDRFHLVGVDMAGKCHTLMIEPEMPAATRSTLH